MRRMAGILNDVLAVDPEEPVRVKQLFQVFQGEVQRIVPVITGAQESAFLERIEIDHLRGFHRYDAAADIHGEAFFKSWPPAFKGYQSIEKKVILAIH